MKKKVLLTIICFLGIYSISTALKPAGTILYPTDNESNVSIQPTIQIADSNWATEVEYLISTDSSFNDTTLHKTIFYDTTYSLNALALGLSFKEDYYIKMRLSDSTQLSEWSSTNKFSTVNSPTITFPLDSTTTHVASDLTWKSNAYDMEVQFWKDSLDADTIVFFIKGDEFTYNFEEEIFFSDLTLGYNESYFARVRQNDSTYGLSDWSGITYFSTEQPPQLLSPQPNPITIQNVDYLEENELTDMTETRDVTSNEVVGSINGVLKVNPNGSAEYNIEIWSPPGTNGIKPSISLNYNSQSGAGLAGWGWNISGLSAISRTRKSKYLDGIDEELKLDNTDLLSLDGNRLITTDEGTTQIYGNAGTIYTTRSGNSVRVEHVNGNTGNSNAHFKVTDKQGSVSIYGGTTDSKAKLSPANHLHTDHVVSWRLNKVMDIHGNYIEYIYEDSFEGMNLIKEIKYTGYESEDGNSDLDTYASIEFEYAQKASGNQYLNEVYDQDQFYGNGLFQKNSLVIKNIIIKYEGQEVKRYSLEYIYDDVTYLHRIREYGLYDQNINNSVVKNETAFEYYLNEPKVSSKLMDEVPSYIDDDEYSLHFGDFNGDGIQDRLIIDRNETTVVGDNRAVGYLQHGSYFECIEDGATNNEYNCTGDIVYTSAASIETGRDAGFCFDVFDYEYRGTLLSNRNIIIADFNNDGRDDIILPFLNDWNERLNRFMKYNTLESFGTLAISIYEGTEDQINWVTSYNRLEENRIENWENYSVALVNEHFLPADYTGDGTLELVYQVEYHATNDRDDQFLFYLDIVDEFGNFKNRGQVINVAEPLRKDLRVNEQHKSNYIYRNLGPRSHINGDFYTVEVISNGKAELLFSQEGNSSDEGVYTIEFDQYGEPYLNQEVVINSSNPDLDLKNKLFTSDFNGDGYTDILFRNDEEKEDDKDWYIRYWNGHHFTEKFKLDMPDYSSLVDPLYRSDNELKHLKPVNILLGDFNGDGKTDIYWYWYHIPNHVDDAFIGPALFGSVLFSKGVNDFETHELYKYCKIKSFTDPTIPPLEIGIHPGNEFLLEPNRIERLIFSTHITGKEYKDFSIIGDYRLKDLNGDGNSDLISPHSISSDPNLNKANDAIIMFNPDQHNRHLKTISDGFGNRTKINYSPISKGSINNINEEIFRKDISTTPSESVKPLNSGIWVVNEIEKYMSKNATPIQSIGYSYGKSVFHKQLGFVGFKEFFSKSFDDLNTTNNSENRQFFKILNNESDKVFTLIPDSSSLFRNGEIISSTIYDKVVDFYDDGNFLIYDNDIISIDYKDLSKVTMHYEYYGDKNLQSEETITSNLDESKIINSVKKIISYTSKGLSWGGEPINNKIDSEILETQYFNYDENGNLINPPLPNNPVYTTTTKYEYKTSLDNFMLDKIISFYQESKSVEKKFEYDQFGNTTKITLDQSEDNLIPPRVVDYNFNAIGRFVESINNGIGITSKIYNDVFGLPTREINIQGNSIYYDEYDSFGRLEKKRDEFLNEINYSTEWFDNASNPGYNQDILYKSIISSTNSPNIILYYDGFGQLLRKETEATKNKNTVDYIVQTFEYFPDGRNKKNQKPYFLSESPSGKYIEKMYDDFLREEKTIDQGRENTIEYDYDGTPRLTRVTSSDGKTKEILMNEAGVTELTRDNQGFEVRNQYKNDMLSSIVTTIALDNESNEVITNYDRYGNKVSIEDNDAGIYTYDYNAFGDLRTETAPTTGINSYKYDDFGRIKERNNSEGTIVYEYYTSPDLNNPVNGTGNIKSISGPNPADFKLFTYDQFGRLTNKMVQIQSEVFNYVYEYKSNTDLLEYKTLPSGVKVEYKYNDLNDLVEVNRVATDNTLIEKLWSFEENNSFGMTTKYTQGNNVIYNELVLDQYQLPEEIRASTKEWSSDDWDLQNWIYEFDKDNGNLKKRIDVLTNQTEKFRYDGLDRIWKILNANDQNIYEMSYYNDGSIETKPETGTYSYLEPGNTTGAPDFPYHAVKYIQNNPKILQGHEIQSTSFNSVKTINSDCEFYANIDYSSSNQRNKMDIYYKGVDLAPGILQYSKYYLEEYEMKKYPNGDRKEVTYISSPVGVIATIINEYDNSTSSQSENLYFVLSDYLGSVERLTFSNGDIVPNARFSYNIWGELRDPNKWYDFDDNNKLVPPDKITLEKFEFLERGFTGHEHISEFTLINMNGRIYDQMLGQFIQPDNYIALPGESQSYNRFSYVLNNPLKYTDPSGEWIGLAIAGVMTSYNALHAYNYGGGQALYSSIGMSLGGMALGVATSTAYGEIFKSLGMTTINASLDVVLSQSGSALAGALSGVTTSFLLASNSSSKFTASSIFASAATGSVSGLMKFQKFKKMAEDAFENHMKKVNQELKKYDLASDGGMAPTPAGDLNPYKPNAGHQFMIDWETSNNNLLNSNNSFYNLVGGVNTLIYNTLDATSITGDFILYKVGMKEYGVQNLKGEYINMPEIRDAVMESLSMAIGWMGKLYLSFFNITLRTASIAYKGSTKLGHSFSKKAGRKPELWGKTSGAMTKWHSQALIHYDDIMNGPGGFSVVTEDGLSFFEKKLPDGRGIRIQMNGEFKGFID